jgi:anti-anti-sigma factor
MLPVAMSNSYNHISVQQTAGVSVLTIQPKKIATYELAEAIGQELIDASQKQSPPKVVVDLAKVEYMSSVGYGPLITLRGRIRESGGRLVLCGLSEVVLEMFEATRLLINPRSPKALFEVAASPDAAVAMLTSQH